jgi:anti-sigma regulatory factor (Ser/Thr protein kinase)
MCRVRSRVFPPDAASVPAARRWVSGLLAHWELAAPVNDVMLLTSELVTNGVVHARSLIIVTVAVADGLLEIGVGDHDRRSPRISTQTSNWGRRSGAPDTDSDLTWLAAGGRGLGLVDHFADEWGVANLTTGKQVWFRFAVAQSWPHGGACPCRRTDLTRIRLDSGRYAVGVPGRWDEDGP